MPAIWTSRPLVVIYIILVLLGVLAVVNVLIITYNGTAVAVPKIPRSSEHFGQNGQSIPLTYVVLGDSTAVAQGTDYDAGYARATARFIAGYGYNVSLYNFAVSGARARDVAKSQAAQATAVNPDIILIAVTANDVTHFTSIDDVRQSLTATISQLRQSEKQPRIILTGSPQMGAVARFPEAARSIARLRTSQINTMVRRLATDKQVLFAPIAEKTGPIFTKHPDYFAQDKFHPNAAGYATWTAVLEDTLRTVLSHS